MWQLFYLQDFWLPQAHVLKVDIEKTKVEMFEKPKASAPILGNKKREKDNLSKWSYLSRQAAKTAVPLHLGQHFATFKKRRWRLCRPLG